MKREDPRIAHTRQIVLSAAVTELVEVGFERISIDAIAERSGVARSTIYRNWKDRETLLAEAFRMACSESPADLPETGDLQLDLENLGRQLADLLTSELWVRTVPSLVSAAMHDEAMAELLSSFSDERASEAQLILKRAVERGEIDASDDLELVMERFVAPFFLRRLVSRRPLDETFIKAQVAMSLEQLHPFRGCS